MKRSVTLLLSAVMLWSLCACGGGSPSSSEPASGSASAGASSGGETMVLRLANSHNAEHITSQACQMKKPMGALPLSATLPASWATSAPPSSSASSAG